MKKPLRIHEIEALAETHSPATIRRKFADRLDEEGLTFLDDLERIGTQVDQLGRKLRPLIGTPPDVPGLPPKHFWKSAWMGPFGWLLSAALILLFILLPSGDVSHKPLIEEGLMTTRGSDPAHPDQFALDRAVYEAHMERGRHFLDLGGRENLKAAFHDFQYAMRLQPEEKEAVQELILACEALGLHKEQAFLTEKLESMQ